MRVGRGQRATVRGIAGMAVALTALGLTGCGRSEDGGSPTGLPRVIASTDVWGSVARTVAGDDAEVTSLITSASADPHSFEASPADAAAITDASVVVYNGGGYDQWVDTVLENHPGIPTISAYSLLDAAAVGERQPANEHVFYELNTAKAVAGQIAARLSEENPQKSADYRSRAEEFGRKADAVLQREREIGAAHPGAAVVATEPVAHYLLTAAKLTDKTPPGFSNAIEQDTDPAPVDVAAMLDLIAKRDVSALLYNEQTATEVTRKVRAAADSAGIPVVQVTETLPAGGDYLTWQSDTADRLAAALGKNP